MQVLREVYLFEKVRITTDIFTIVFNNQRFPVAHLGEGEVLKSSLEQNCTNQ